MASAEEWAQLFGALGSGSEMTLIECFDKHKNELLRNWIKVSHLIDEMDDAVLCMSMETIINLFGGMRSLLKELVSQSTNNKQLLSLFALLKEKNNEYQNANPIQPDFDTNSASSPTLRLNRLPIELLSFVSCFLDRDDIASFKLVSWNIAVVCLEEMTKISVTIMNANHLIDSRMSMIQFTSINTYQKQQLTQVTQQINAFKSQQFDLEFDASNSINLQEKQRINKQKADVISLIKIAKEKQRSLHNRQAMDTSLHPSCMQRERIPFNTTFYDIFDRFGTTYGIPMKHQLIYQFDYPFNLFTDSMTNEVQLTHVDKRCFIVFDRRNIIYPDTKRKDHTIQRNSKVLLLKYYDIHQEKLHFVGYMILNYGSTLTSHDLIQYLESQFVPHLCHQNQSPQNQWYHSLYSYLQRIMLDQISKKLRVYREEWSINGNRTGKATHFVNGLQILYDSVFCGDILIFQLNFVHNCVKRESIVKRDEKERTCDKWYYKVEDYVLDDMSQLGITLRHETLDMNNLRHYIQTHLGITNEMDITKTLRKVATNCAHLKIHVGASYCYGDIRKYIARSMNHVIPADRIHLYVLSVSNPKQPYVLPWHAKIKGSRRAQCRWSIVTWNTQDVGISDYICSIKVYKPSQIPTPFYAKHVQFITVKLTQLLTSKQIVQRMMECMTEPLVEQKYQDILALLKTSDWDDNDTDKQFKVVLCVGTDTLNSMALDERVCDYFPALNSQYILRMHLFITPKINIDLQPDEALLYVRFTLEPIRSGKRYTEFCRGIPIQLVIKRVDSLQSIIDSGALEQYGVLGVGTCYRINNRTNTHTQIRRQRVSRQSFAMTWDYYKPFEKFIKHNPTDHVAMYVEMEDAADVNNNEKRCVLGTMRE
eukprot:43456_1